MHCPTKYDVQLQTYMFSSLPHSFVHQHPEEESVVKIILFPSLFFYDVSEDKCFGSVQTEVLKMFVLYTIIKI